MQFSCRDWLRFLFSSTTIVGGSVFAAFRIDFLNSVFLLALDEIDVVVRGRPEIAVRNYTCCFKCPANYPIPFKWIPCYSFAVLLHFTPKGASTIEWVTPPHEQAALNSKLISHPNAVP